MSPRDRIIELLKSYPYAVAGAGTSKWSDIGPRWDSAALRHEDLWYATDSYEELDKQLRGLRAVHAEAYWHVTRRYLDAEVRPMTVLVRKVNQYKREPVLAPYCELAGGLPGSTGRTCRVLVRRWDHRVRESLVSEALAWLERSMYGGQSSRITLPADLLAEAV